MNKDTFIKEINKLGINLDEKKINSILTGDDNLDVYTLMRILQKKINNE